MSRRRRADVRVILPDSQHGNIEMARFINKLMREGKKSVAANIFYGALERVVEKLPDIAVNDIFTRAMNNVKPVLEVKSRRVGGSNYQVPVEVRSERQGTLAMRWLINAARDRGEKTMTARLASEIFDAYNNTGSAVKKKEDTHRMAEANKAFAHYRW